MRKEVTLTEHINVNDSLKVNIEGYLKFFGSAVDEGKIDIEEIGHSLIALKKMFNIYQNELLSQEVSTSHKGDKKNKKKIPLSEQEDKKLTIKLGGIKKNCTEVNIYFEHIVPIASQAVDYAGAIAILNATGVTGFCKQFMANVADQVTLKLFKGNQKNITRKEFVEGGVIYVELSDKDGNSRVFKKDTIDHEKVYSPHMKDFVRLGSGINKMETGYKEEGTVTKGAEVKEKEKPFFEYVKEKNDIDTRLQEEFDDSIATPDGRLVGQFIDFYGMAHKYHFAFQARENQESVGKKKVLCVVDEDSFDLVFESLKESYKNKKHKICIGGDIIKDSEGRVDKIKINWISEDKKFNPEQNQLLQVAS